MDGRSSYGNGISAATGFLKMTPDGVVCIVPITSEHDRYGDRLTNGPDGCLYGADWNSLLRLTLPGPNAVRNLRIVR
jgi:hypothetical protein